MSRIVFLIFGLLLTQVAQASGSAVLRDGTCIDFDEDRVRMTMDSGASDARNEMIYRDGKAYVIQGGKVYDISQMMPAMVGALSSTGKGPDVHDTTRVKLRDTGRSEKVAGISGKVYVAESMEDSGQVSRSEMVLSKHPLAVELTQAMAHVASSMAGANARVWSKGPLENQGVLRVDQDFMVSSLQDQRFSDDHFALPSRPQAMPNFQGIMQSMGGNGAPPIANPLSRQPERARSRVDSEVNNAADRVVDRAVDQILRGLIP